MLNSCMLNNLIFSHDTDKAAGAYTESCTCKIYV